MADPVTVPGPSLTRPAFLRLAVMTEGALMALGLLIAFMAGLDVRSPWYLDLRSFGLGLAALLPMLGFFLFAIRTRWRPLRRIRDLLMHLLGQALAECSTWELCWTGLLAGLAEEFFFRGVLQPLLSRWTDTPTAVGLTALVFGLLHALTPAYAVLATILGVYLGALAELSSTGAAPNIVPAVVAHGVYDFVAFVLIARIWSAERQPAVSARPSTPSRQAVRSDLPHSPERPEVNDAPANGPGLR